MPQFLHVSKNHFKQKSKRSLRSLLPQPVTASRATSSRHAGRELLTPFFLTTQPGAMPVPHCAEAFRTRRIPSSKPTRCCHHTPTPKMRNPTQVKSLVQGSPSAQPQSGSGVLFLYPCAMRSSLRLTYHLTGLTVTSLLQASVSAPVKQGVMFRMPIEIPSSSHKRKHLVSLYPVQAGPYAHTFQNLLSPLAIQSSGNRKAAEKL